MKTIGDGTHPVEIVVVGRPALSKELIELMRENNMKLKAFDTVAEINDRTMTEFFQEPYDMVHHPQNRAERRKASRINQKRKR